MTIQSYAHQTIAWVKQRLDDADAILDEIEKSAADVKADARKQGLYAGIPEISVSPAPVPPRAHPGR